MRGFLRKDGRKGIRNVVLVSYLVECAHHVAARIAQHYQQEEVHLIGFSGCAPNDYAEIMMQQLCTHPNVGAVLLVSLGCENFQRERLLRYQGERAPGLAHRHSGRRRHPSFHR